MVILLRLYYHFIYKAPPVFVPKNGEGGESNIGILKLKLGDELIINDGQHRCAGIAAALSHAAVRQPPAQPS